jgi:hypothetical protein
MNTNKHRHIKRMVTTPGAVVTITAEDQMTVANAANAFALYGRVVRSTSGLAEPIELIRADVSFDHSPTGDPQDSETVPISLETLQHVLNAAYAKGSRLWDDICEACTEFDNNNRVTD